MNHLNPSLLLALRSSLYNTSACISISTNATSSSNNKKNVILNRSSKCSFSTIGSSNFNTTNAPRNKMKRTILNIHRNSYSSRKYYYLNCKRNLSSIRNEDKSSSIKDSDFTQNSTTPDTSPSKNDIIDNNNHQKREANSPFFLDKKNNPENIFNLTVFQVIKEYLKEKKQTSKDSQNSMHNEEQKFPLLSYFPENIVTQYGKKPASVSSLFKSSSDLSPSTAINRKSKKNYLEPSDQIYFGKEIEAEIIGMAPNGSGIAIFTVHRTTTIGNPNMDNKNIKRDAKLFKEDSQEKEIWVVLVPNTLKDEIVKLRLVSAGLCPGYLYGTLIKVLKPSPKRIIPRCKHFEQCSACHLQHMNDSEQVQWKQSLLKTAIDSHQDAVQFSSDFKLNPIINSPKSFDYRTRMDPCYKRSGNDIHFGYVSRDSLRSLLEIEECPIMKKELISSFMNSKPQLIGKIQSGDKKFIYGSIAFKLGYNSESTSEKVLDEGLRKLVFLGDTKSEVRSAESLIQEELNRSIKELSQEFSSNSKNWKHVVTYNERGVATEVVGDLVFNTPINSFFRTNSSILPLYLNYIFKELYSITSTNKVVNLVDAFAGCGVFPIKFAPLFKNIVAIEYDDRVARWGKANVVGNFANIPEDTKIQYKHGRNEDVFLSTVRDNNHFNPLETVVLVDPGRHGLSVKFIKQLLYFNPRVIIYSSPFFPYQLRDVRFLTKSIDEVFAKASEPTPSHVKGYKLVRSQPFNSAPQLAIMDNVMTLIREDLHFVKE